MAEKKEMKKPVPKGKRVHCQLPGAELLEQGASVEEIMDTLESSLPFDEERFCEEYVSCGVAVRAALRVWPDHSYEYASTKAERLMRKDEINRRIRQLTNEYKERYGLTESKLLKRLAALAFFDRRCLYRPDGTLKQVHELTEEEAAALIEVETRELFAGTGDQRTVVGLISKAKFADPRAAIELAGRHLKLWKDPGTASNPFVSSDLEKLSDEELKARADELHREIKEGV